MKIWVYTICWNEADMLPYFLRHYEAIADKIIIYDNHSSDETVEIAKSHPLVEVRTIGKDELDERNLLWVKGESWKEARQEADWVICCDVDEFLYHPETREYLQECLTSSITFPRVQGYELVSEAFPMETKNIHEIVRTGFCRHNYSKRVVFSPNAIEEINYSPGCHRADPIGQVNQDPTCKFKLLHGGSIGRRRQLDRRITMANRNSESNKKKGFAAHYSIPLQEMEQLFDRFVAGSKPLWFLNGQARAPWELASTCMRIFERLIRVKGLERL